MIDDPIAFAQFKERFASNQACISALFDARWPDGFRCPCCGQTRYFLIRTRRLPLFECASCRRQTSLISGTVMEGSSTSLPRWFQAIYLLSQPSGIAATELRDILGVTYKTAWLIAHKIRHALSLEVESRILSGNVHIEHADYGPALYLDARQPLLLAASLDEQQQPEFFRFWQPSPDHVEEGFFRRIARAGIEAFRTTCTDGSPATIIPPAANRRHPALRDHRRHVECWLNDTFCGIRPKHLQAYLNEYGYRANHAADFLGPGLLLGSVLRLSAITPAITYPELTKDRPVLLPPWHKFESKKKWRGKWLRLYTAV
ncbi:transposase [Cohnella fermenti]|uniref:IS1595 family transposase n=1 Tax=Cohnella fermenti TaxID=2565925 RepID=A0A4S4C6A2_9BACL|nr:transposase [Cohnella fermenti]THF83420.1 IS1595 family transposase [Cohnella fermenti]